MRWPRVTVTTPQGPCEAVAPLVISASRATDIPALYPEAFLRALRRGHCLWCNPFNARQRQYVSFARCRVIVFWSKNPAPLLPCLEEVHQRGYQFYFQYTLNDYTDTGLEPGLPPLEQRLATFAALSAHLGAHRVIWRFDPIIMGGGLTPQSLLERFTRLGERLAPLTSRCVFSFVDAYAKSRRSLAALDPTLRPPTPEEMHCVASGMAEVAKGWNLPLATCAEAVDMRALGIAPNRCVDPELLLRLCPGDTPLHRACAGALRGIRDRGQRPACGCAPSKDIGSYNTCTHLCAYCYANHSRQSVLRHARDGFV